jgi:hypothetical protein
MEFIIIVLSIFGLAFLIKESDGPFDIMNKGRSWLLTNKYVGTFFYGLLNCYFCLGFHCGWLVYLLSAESYKWQFFILYALAGGVISLILDRLLGYQPSSP